jgi:hypothetical protein
MTASLCGTTANAWFIRKSRISGIAVDIGQAVAQDLDVFEEDVRGDVLADAGAPFVVLPPVAIAVPAGISDIAITGST